MCGMKYGVIPKDDIDLFFACKKCGMVGCDCETEQNKEDNDE